MFYKKTKGKCFTLNLIKLYIIIVYNMKMAIKLL